MQFKKNQEAVDRLWTEMEKIKSANPGVMIPPESFLEMQAEFLDYVYRKEIVTSCPVLKKQTNPLNNMQGGFITAAIDNTMGPLSFLAARGPAVTIDLNTQYIRPIKPDDTLFCIARVVMISPVSIFMSAEAFNSKEKLIASATSNILILKVTEKKES